MASLNTELDAHHHEPAWGAPALMDEANPEDGGVVSTSPSASTGIWAAPGACLPWTSTHRLEELSALMQRIEEEEAMNPTAIVIWQCKGSDFAFGFPQT